MNRFRPTLAPFALAALCILSAAAAGATPAVRCANLIYGNNQTSRCFNNAFLEEVSLHSHIVAEKEFAQVRMESMELFRHPFAVMSGEGHFSLTQPQRDNLRRYLLNGGFLVASAGCSSRAWGGSFTREFEQIFPEYSLVKLPPEHPIFHTITDVEKTAYRRGERRFPDLFGLEIDGRICLIYSPDGLNDTATIKDSSCCCCGGNEIRDAKWINMNVLAFALTH